MSAVAVETAVDLRAGLRGVFDEPVAQRSCDEDLPVPSDGVEDWELHSELVLVCPEVCKRALELLPERDPDAFLAALRQPSFLPSTAHDERELSLGLPTAVLQYALWRLAQTARVGLLTVGAVIALASLAELLH
jgi:hypothetical protein